MTTLHKTKQFKKDFKREKKTDAGTTDLLQKIVDLLVEGETLPEKLKDHSLIGDWKDHRECHLKPDLLLIYRIGDDGITLVRLGSHSELFS